VIRYSVHNIPPILNLIYKLYIIYLSMFECFPPIYASLYKVVAYLLSD